MVFTVHPILCVYDVHADRQIKFKIHFQFPISIWSEIKWNIIELLLLYAARIIQNVHKYSRGTFFLKE